MTIQNARQRASETAHFRASVLTPLYPQKAQFCGKLASAAQNTLKKIIFLGGALSNFMRPRIADGGVWLCRSAPQKRIMRSVYFAGSDNGPIKIGMSCDPRRRLKELQTPGQPRLKLLAVKHTGGVGSFEEGRYHERFAEHALGNEWFERHPDILAEIDRLNTPSSRAAA